MLQDWPNLDGLGDIFWDDFFPKNCDFLDALTFSLNNRLSRLFLVQKRQQAIFKSMSWATLDLENRRLIFFRLLGGTLGDFDL